MDEYIKREEAISKCREISACEWNHRAAPISWSYAYEQFSEDLEELPAADVAPVRHGEWILGKDLPYSWGQILKNKYHLYCSECLEQAFNRSEDNDPDFDVDTPYCPFCGCCMDGGAD